MDLMRTSSIDLNLKIKILMLGESDVAKTSLLLRFAEDRFVLKQSTTIGFDFRNKHVEIDGQQVKLLLWDTSGQERFRSITPSYYRGAHGILLVYDITNRRSFHRFREWIADIHAYVDKHTDIILIGNKLDINNRVISYEEGKSLATEFDMEFYEISAKYNVNVERSFMNLADD